MQSHRSTPIIDRGVEIYDSRLRPLLELAHLGEYLVINVDTGEFEVDPDHLADAVRAAKRWTNAPCYATRVGSRTLGRIGSGVLQRP